MEPYLAPPRYSLIKPLVRGGQGSIYLVFDEDTGERRILKLEDDLSGWHERTAATYLELSRHPEYFVLPLSYSRLGSKSLLIYPYIHGDTLGSLMARADFQATLRREGNLQAMIVSLCFMVAVAHDAGVVHADLSRSNVMVAQKGRTLRLHIIDFGYASALCRHPVRLQAQETAPARYDPRLFHPEPFPEWEADVYALGALVTWLHTELKLEAPAFVQQMQTQPRPTALACSRRFATSRFFPSTRKTTNVGVLD